jgi:hypothetical protein
LIQVAEFVSPVISTYQCAWALAHLCGYYGHMDVHLTLEINGPGEAVFNELNALRRMTAQMTDGARAEGQPDIRRVLVNMRHFMYRRVDALRGGDMVWQWRTTGMNKAPMMAAFKDAFELKRLVLNSMPLLEEMQTIVIDGGHIAAEVGKKDDRVLAAALAHEGYRRWRQRKLEGMGETMQKAYDRATGAGPDVVQNIAINYLKSQNISIEDFKR